MAKKVVARLGINPFLLAAARAGLKRDRSGRFLKGSGAKGDGPQGGELFQVIREAMAEAAMAWFTNILPRHFKGDAPYRYKGVYTERTWNYKAKKKKKWGHANDLVYTGRMRDETLSGSPLIRGRAAGQSLRTEIRLPHARAQNLWSGTRRTKSGAAHNFRLELVALNEQDTAELRAVTEKATLAKASAAMATGQMNMVRIEHSA